MIYWGARSRRCQTSKTYPCLPCAITIIFPSGAPSPPAAPCSLELKRAVFRHPLTNKKARSDRRWPPCKTLFSCERPCFCSKFSANNSEATARLAVCLLAKLLLLQSCGSQLECHWLRPCCDHDNKGRLVSWSKIVSQKHPHQSQGCGTGSGTTLCYWILPLIATEET